MNRGRHILSAFDRDLETVQALVVKMGGLVEAQVAQAVWALTNFSDDIAAQVLKTEERVNALEVEIDRDLSTIIARRQPTARDLRLLIAVSRKRPSYASSPGDCWAFPASGVPIRHACKWTRPTAAAMAADESRRGSPSLAYGASKSQGSA